MTLGKPGYHRRKIGDAIITAIFDGRVDVALDNILGIDPAESARLQREALRSEPPALDTSFFVIERDDDVFLVDTGGNKALDAGLGHGKDNLQAAGIDRERVTHVLLTHLHSDHYGGLLDDDGNAAFPNATLLPPALDRTFRLYPPDYDDMPADTRNMIDRIRRYVAPYRANIRFITEGEVLPGINAIPLPGHTPGHTGYSLSSGDEKIIFYGDVIHFPAVQFRHPGSSMSYDVDPKQAATSRQALFEQVSADGTMVAGAHMNFPCFGHVMRDTGVAFRWVAASFLP
ncbi:MAG: hypothetical protein RLZZ444_3491 [Pseudomonadota bacterium]|jgi:glyoxylase-like metal-dependent hydrolase (beta-lactamase superfamily II)